MEEHGFSNGGGQRCTEIPGWSCSTRLMLLGKKGNNLFNNRQLLNNISPYNGYYAAFKGRFWWMLFLFIFIFRFCRCYPSCVWFVVKLRPRPPFPSIFLFPRGRTGEIHLPLEKIIRDVVSVGKRQIPSNLMYGARAGIQGNVWRYRVNYARNVMNFQKSDIKIVTILTTEFTSKYREKKIVWLLISQFSYIH